MTRYADFGNHGPLPTPGLSTVVVQKGLTGLEGAVLYLQRVYLEMMPITKV